MLSLVIHAGNEGGDYSLYTFNPTNAFLWILPSCYTQVTIKDRGPRDVILLVFPF